jgi:hypothetical protein
MRKHPQFSEEAIEDARASLLLPLASEAMPFALVGDECNFGPDDWAWIFLSMDEGYRDAYQDRIESLGAEDDKVGGADQGISQHLLDRSNSIDVRADLDGSCRSRFGLAAWLSPTVSTLPHLKNKQDSWFFPLNCPISEDYRRKEVSNKVYVRTGPLYLSHIDKYPHLVVGETPFGYKPAATAPSRAQVRHADWALTWVAIDCSVPPDGQVSALKTLALMNRKHLVDFGYKTYDEMDEKAFQDAVVATANSDAFGHMHFRRAGGATKLAADISRLWWAVCVDALGPIGIQTDRILKTLKAEHEILLGQQLAEPPQFRRFKNTLPSAKDRDDQPRYGGSYLKALCVIAELSAWGWTANQIAKIVGVCDENNHHKNNWRKQFHEDIEAYIVDSEVMIRGGYRYLVQARKPDIAPPQ